LQSVRLSRIGTLLPFKRALHLQCVAVCAAVCCSVLQRVAVCLSRIGTLLHLKRALHL